MREVVLDTETTGLNPKNGDRIIEIGCLEMVNHIATGEQFQRYIDPERDVPEDSVRIHGITNEMLRGKPKFADIVEDFLVFIGDARLVIHNAGFDLAFLNAELTRTERAIIQAERAVDTVALARRKFPGAPASLDALCKRFGVDNSARTVHGALLDAQLLADVYVELIGGRQPDLALSTAAIAGAQRTTIAARETRPPRPHGATDEERAAHDAFLERLSGDVIWRH